MGSWDSPADDGAKDPPGSAEGNGSDGNDSNGWDWDSNEDGAPGIPDYPEPEPDYPPPPGGVR